MLNCQNDRLFRSQTPNFLLSLTNMTWLIPLRELEKCHKVQRSGNKQDCMLGLSWGAVGGYWVDDWKPRTSNRILRSKSPLSAGSIYCLIGLETDGLPFHPCLIYCFKTKWLPGTLRAPLIATWPVKMWGFGSPAKGNFYLHLVCNSKPLQSHWPNVL